MVFRHLTCFQYVVCQIDLFWAVVNLPQWPRNEIYLGSPARLPLGSNPQPWLFDVVLTFHQKEVTELKLHRHNRLPY